MKSDCPKSSNFDWERNENIFSVNTIRMMNDPKITRRDDIDLDTDIIPAEELDSSEKKKMVENVENIGNDTLLINFYKNKVEDQQKENSPDRKHYQNYTERTSVPLKTRDLNRVKEEDTLNTNSGYLQSNSKRQLSGYIPKHYQIPKKGKSSVLNSHGTS